MNNINLQHSKPLTVYVDGSYNVKTKVVGMGYVMTDGLNNFKASDHYDDPELSQLRNVAGELSAVLNAIQIAQLLNAPSLDIYYDYQGIEAWVTGAWRAKKDFTKSYRSAVHAAMKKVDISFHKVKAHSGVELNEVADRLAKMAAGV